MDEGLTQKQYITFIRTNTARKMLIFHISIENGRRKELNSRIE